MNVLSLQFYVARAKETDNLCKNNKSLLLPLNKSEPPVNKYKFDFYYTNFDALFKTYEYYVSIKIFSPSIFLK